MWIQLYNSQFDVFFLNCLTAKGQWYIDFKKPDLRISHVAHIAENDLFYYEDVQTGDVTWTIPSINVVGVDAEAKAAELMAMNRFDMESEFDSLYGDDVSEVYPSSYLLFLPILTLIIICSACQATDRNSRRLHRVVTE